MRSINSRSNTVQASLFTTNYSWKVRTKYQCFSHATERSEVFHHGLLLCWWQNKTSWCVHSENVGLPGLALAPGTTEHLKKPEEIISPILTNPNFGNPDFQEKNVVKNEPAFFASQLESLCQYLYCEMWRMSDMWQQSRREWTLPSRWLCPEWFRTFCCNDRFVLILLPLNSNRLYSFLNYVIECQVLRSTVPGKQLTVLAVLLPVDYSSVGLNFPRIFRSYQWKAIISNIDWHPSVIQCQHFLVLLWYQTTCYLLPGMVWLVLIVPYSEGVH